MNTPLKIFAIATTFLFVGCGAAKVEFLGSQVVPAAKATAKVAADDNGNGIVSLKLEHLAPSNRLSPPKATYVVWAQTAEGRALPLGRLVIGEKREGSFQGTTPFQEFRVMITAEDVYAPERPSEPAVLSTEFLRTNPRAKQ